MGDRELTVDGFGRDTRLDALVEALDGIGAALTLTALLQMQRQAVDPVTRADVQDDIDRLSYRLGNRYSRLTESDG